MGNKFYCISVLGLLFSMIANAQGPIADPVVVPPSPEASELTKVSNYPDATYSGIPDISIPLFEYKGNSISYELGISYNAQGLKVKEEASAIGLGWALNATGVITREIRGIDDLSAKGFYKVNPASFTLGNGNDSSPDVFSFNLLGVTGKFILNYDPSSPGNYKVVILNQVPIKIELINSRFKVTDSSGNVFSFNSIENTRSDVIPSTGGSTTTNYISSWFLTSLKSPVNDEITFQYISNPRKIRGEYKSAQFTEFDSESGPCAAPHSPDQISITTVRTSTEQLLLNQINFPNGTIQFHTTSRIDLDYEGANLPLKYSKITIKSNSLDYNKEIEFKQSYFSSGSGNADKISKRLQLQGIYEKSSSQIVKTYSFVYNSLSLPDKDSHSTDYWGFYNGQLNNTPFDNKEPSSSDVQASMLTSIVYPTGAKIVYTFESNDYMNYSSTLMDENPPNSPYGGKIGPGCRIAKIEQFDHNNISLGKKLYNYSDGKRMNGSRYSQLSSNTVTVDKCTYGGLDQQGKEIWYPGTVTVFYRSKMSSSNFSATIGAGGYEIGYGQVTELYSNQGDNGKKDFYFFNESNIVQLYPGLPRFIENKNGYLKSYIISKKNGTGYTKVEERINTVKVTNGVTVNAKILLPSYTSGSLYDQDFSIVSNWKYVDTVIVNKYDEQGLQKNSEKSIYYYDNVSHKQLTRVSEDLSDSRKKWKFYQYPHDYSTGNATINLLKSNHILNAVVEEVTGISNGSTYTITGGISSEFNASGNGLKNADFYLEVSTPIPLSSFKFSSRAIGSLFPAANRYCHSR